MTNLITSSFSRLATIIADRDLEQQNPPDPIDEFLKEIHQVRDEIKHLDSLQKALHDANEHAKFLYQASAIRANRAQMEADVASCLDKAKLVKLRLNALDCANVANRNSPGCGPGSMEERTRMVQVEMLRKKLKDSMMGFNRIRQKVAVDCREEMQRRYYTVTGEQPDKALLDTLISTGEAETFLQRVIQSGGKGEVMEVVTEIRERHDASKELEKSLVELHQVFWDMGVLVEAQGEQLNRIDYHMKRALSFVIEGTEQVRKAVVHLKSSRKWACIGILILLFIVFIVVVLSVVLNSGNKNKN